jgi:SAM-dependent methyltransferase
MDTPAVTARPVARTPAPATAPDDGAALCCVCGTQVRGWLPHPQQHLRSDFMQLMDTVGSDLSIYLCPHCQCNDRDRHLWLYLNAAGIAAQLTGARVLHIAPERHLEVLIAQQQPAQYVRGDLHPTRPDHVRLDVEALGFADESLELIICNHVLEHVGDPLKALREMRRCLVPGGLLVAQTPFSPRLMRTMEMTTPDSPEFARLFFGQEDHVRLFGIDLFDLFTQVGFQGQALAHDTVLPGIDARRYGCNVREPFFCFYK